MREWKSVGKLLPVAALVAVSGALSGCSVFDRSSPDEFQVAARAPLEVPPDYNLRPPQPGSPRPQELERDVRATSTVFGAAGGGTAGLIDPRASAQQSSGEGALLAQAGADQANPEIRAIVDRENPGVVVGDRSFLDRILFWRDDQPAQTVHQGAPPTIARTGTEAVPTTPAPAGR